MAKVKVGRGEGSGEPGPAPSPPPPASLLTLCAAEIIHRARDYFDAFSNLFILKLTKQRGLFLMCWFVGFKVSSHLDPYQASTLAAWLPNGIDLYLFLDNGKLIAGHRVTHFDLFSLEEAAGGGGGTPSWVINMAATATKTSTAAACKPWIKFKHLFCLRPPSVYKSPARLYDQCQDPLSPLCAPGCISLPCPSVLPPQLLWL